MVTRVEPIASAMAWWERRRSMVIPSLPGTPKSRQSTSRKLTSREDMSRWVRVSIMVSVWRMREERPWSSSSPTLASCSMARRTEVAGAVTISTRVKAMAW